MIDPKYLREVAAVWAEASKKGRERGEGGVLSFWGIGYNQHRHGQNNVCRGANQQVIEMLDSIAPLDAAIAPL